jgi:hypothetical protein
MAHNRTFHLAALTLGLTLAVVPADAAEPRPVVVELFTSQGCSSCPPADALLGELARRDGVLALGYHISYWDSLGWKDPLSNQASTDRQRTYARAFTGGQVYTPQIVVDGVSEMVGSDRAVVLAALRNAAEAQPAAIAPVVFAADRRSVSIGTAAGSSARKGEIVLLRFAKRRTTQVGAGENTGRVAEDFNGVEAVSALGAWTGSPREIAIEPPAPGEGLAVLVQAPDGRMLGAAMVVASG